MGVSEAFRHSELALTSKDESPGSGCYQQDWPAINEPSQPFPGGVCVSWLQGNDAACLQVNFLNYINQYINIFL